jgi:hypothetical protein
MPLADVERRGDCQCERNNERDRQHGARPSWSDRYDHEPHRVGQRERPEMAGLMRHADFVLTERERWDRRNRNDDGGDTQESAEHPAHSGSVGMSGELRDFRRKIRHRPIHHDGRPHRTQPDISGEGPTARTTFQMSLKKPRLNSRLFTVGHRRQRLNPGVAGHTH